MYKIWCYLIYGFMPTWETIEEYGLVGYDFAGERDRIGKIMILRCKETGWIKRIKIRN